MNRVVFFTLILLIAGLKSFGQLNKIDIDKADTQEIYYLDNNLERQGAYSFSYKKKLQVSGNFKDDQRDGEWVFTPDIKFRIIAYYKHNKRDSIWNTYINKKLYKTENTRTNSQKYFFSDGSTMAWADSINGSYQSEVYFESGKTKIQLLSDSIYTSFKEYGKTGDTITHITFKNGFPYEVFVNTDAKISGISEESIIEKGSGTLVTWKKSNKTGKYYAGKKLQLLESKPNGKYEAYSASGKITLKGEFTNGYMVGNWEKYKSKPYALETLISYSLDDSIKKDTLNKIKISFRKPSIIVERMPQFLGKDIKAFRSFAVENVEYPPYSKEYGISGRVFVQFAVNSTGRVVDVKIARGVNEELDNEALRIVKSSPYWRPGMQNGKAVKVKFTLPIVFHLN